jgi:hypothetical protein
MPGYALACWHAGLIGKAEAHPLRRIQALLRFRAADPEAIERIHCEIRAELDAGAEEECTA